jgi:hypothetical protein
MATTTDQKLTLNNALVEARALGFTDVLFPTGWYPLSESSDRNVGTPARWQLVTQGATSYVRTHGIRYQLRKGG